MPSGAVWPKSSSPRGHRVVGPGTHRDSAPREVHTTFPSARFLFFFFLARKTTRPPAPFLSRSCVPSAHAAQLAPSPAQPPHFPFRFFTWSLTGGAQPSGSPPTSCPRVSRAPSGPPAITGHVPRSPTFKSLLQATMMLGLHSPPLFSSFPSLTPPLDFQSRPHVHSWPWPPGAASPPLSGLYKHPQGTHRTPSRILELPRLPLPRTPFTTDRSTDCRAIAAARAPSSLVKPP
jgi:hypothetical protein